MIKKMMLCVIIVGYVMGTLGYADHDKKHEQKNDKSEQKKTPKRAIPKKNEMIVSVDGLVCSFCAYGAEKNISKVDFIDRDHFGGDGVSVDIQKGVVKISIEDTQSADFKHLITAITNGGYVATEISFWVTGVIVHTKEGVILQKTNYPYNFELLQFNQKTKMNKPVTLLATYKVTKKIPTKKIPITIQVN